MTDFRSGSDRAPRIEELMQDLREEVASIEPATNIIGLDILGHSGHADTIRRLVAALAGQSNGQPLAVLPRELTEVTCEAANADAHVAVQAALQPPEQPAITLLATDSAAPAPTGSE